MHNLKKKLCKNKTNASKIIRITANLIKLVVCLYK